MAERCEVCEEDFADKRGLANHNRFKHQPETPPATGAFDDEPELDPEVIAAIREEVAAEETAAAAPGDTPEVERRPQGPAKPEGKPGRPGLFDRIRSQKPRDGGPGPSEPGKPETRPTVPKPRRVSTQEFWGDVIEAGSGMVARTGYVPMSRAMAMTSPVGGEIIEDATKGTLIDRGVQPLVRNAAKWQDLGDYLGFIFAIGAAQAQPERAPIMLAFARKRLVNLLPKIAANMVKQRKREKAAAEAIQTIMPEFADLDLGDDPVGGLIEMLFAAPEQPAAPPEPEPAVA